jgi:aminopeptidase N
MIAQSKLARDPHTYSRPNVARVTHLEWDANVDFSSRIISAKATYDIALAPGASEIVFDISTIKIDRVEVNGQPVSFELGPEKKYLGQPLIIPVDSTSSKVSIQYSTAPGAEALLWVEGEKPFLFTQSQAILARTWIPCQDSPGVRITYNARVKVPQGLLALMSAENPQQVSGDGVYQFRMDQPIPSYLMALAVGDIAFKAVGDRTGVYAVPSVLDAAAKEFEDMQRMVEAAEKLYGPYVWGRYDLLVLPAAFPFGGMENPKLTFATPTIIAGDKSLVSLVAHELAHSWSGNLVTNSTWNDFWLNEGFTVYFEQRIMEAVYGRDISEMQAQLARQDLDMTLEDYGQRNMNQDTRLKLVLDERNPDDGMSDIAYNKGYFFLRLIEETAGREKFDAFLKDYFTSHAFQTMDTETFVGYLREKLVTTEMDASIGIDNWIYGEGLPDNAPRVNSQKLDEVDRLAAQWSRTKKTNDIPWAKWGYEERYRFLSSIENFTADDMSSLNTAFDISNTGNNEVLFKWLELSVLKKKTGEYARLEKFLCSVGRRKFVQPLFEALVNSGQTDLAKRIYASARPGYHAVTVNTIDELLGWDAVAAQP